MQVFEAFSQLKDGCISIEHDEHSGCPSSGRNDRVIAKVCDFVRADQRLAIKEIVEELGISSGSCHAILRLASSIYLLIMM
jgi:hypothetical protein